MMMLADECADGVAASAAAPAADAVSVPVFVRASSASRPAAVADGVVSVAVASAAAAFFSGELRLLLRCRLQLCPHPPLFLHLPTHLPPPLMVVAMLVALVLLVCLLMILLLRRMEVLLPPPDGDGYDVVADVPGAAPDASGHDAAFASGDTPAVAVDQAPFAGMADAEAVSPGAVPKIAVVPSTLSTALAGCRGCPSSEAVPVDAGRAVAAGVGDAAL